jgi:hypothetical protein
MKLGTDVNGKYISVRCAYYMLLANEQLQNWRQCEIVGMCPVNVK